MRLRLPTPGLVGSPHVHSSCLGPVSFAGMSSYLRLQAPWAFAQVFAHCRFVYKKKVDPPRAHGPKPFCYSSLCIAPPVVAARAQASRPILQAAAAYIYFISLIRCVLHLAIHPPSSCASIRLAVLLSCSVCLQLYTHFSVELGPVSPPLFHSFPYQDPDDSSIARSPSSRFRASGQLIQVQAQLIFWCSLVPLLFELLAGFVFLYLFAHCPCHRLVREQFVALLPRA